MSTPTTQPPSQPSSSTLTSQQASIIHNVSLGAVVLCPILIILPPRKLDIYTLGLLSGTFIGANQLSTEYTNISIIQRMQNRFERLGSAISKGTGASLPPQALEVQKRLKEEKAWRERETARKFNSGGSAEDGKVLRELERGKKEIGLAEKIWYGGEGDDWKAKRDQREKEALEDGRGYGGLIMDQIWEVWNWGEKKAEEITEVDKKVIKERSEKTK